MDIEVIRSYGESSGRCRAKIYELLERVFVSIPDAEFIDEFMSGAYDDFIDTCGGIGNIDLRRGVAFLESYLSSIISRNPAEILDEIAVDRTRILRVTADKTCRLPYESLYTAACGPGDVVSGIKDFYRKVGIVPEENIGEMPDYLGVEMDFMYQLCLKEIDLWASGKDAGETISIEKEFLETHLGKWISLFCEEADKYCRTDFYKGFLKILSGFIEIEIEYLSGSGV